MKARKRLDAIKKTEHWVTRRALVQDHVPGTEFDFWIDRVSGAIRYAKYFPEADLTKKDDVGARLRNSTLLSFGEMLGEKVAARDSGFFRRLADALDTWRTHKPVPDQRRSALVEICVPPDGPHEMKDILKHLPAYGVEVTQDTPRLVRREAKELGITIKGSPGRPTNK